uniref:Uncharacterized protein n=1 Tax=Romanomermis culicivorax TaxID=13658 RepID=A0A915HKR7_ROMCU
MTQPTSLWCDAHKSPTHNIEDCVWLKGQNTQQLTRHEPNRPTYAAHSRQADFRTNSNDIHGQRDWRPRRGGLPLQGTNYARCPRNHFYEGNSIQRPNDFVQNTYAVYPNHHFPGPWEQHIHYNAVLAPYVTTPTDSSPASSQSSELQLALPMLPPPNATSTPALKTRANNQSTSAANVVIPSKEIASAAPV